MEEFRFKERSNIIRLSVKKERGDGTEDAKVLVFDCSPTNYRFIKRAAEAGKMLESAIKGGLRPSAIDDVVEAERAAFELVAPKEWEEYFQFLDEDVEDMALLLKLMLSTIREKGIEAKKADIVPQAGDGEAI